MVGVPGKSKSCLSCRKRKIQCDLKTPTCDQCQRTNRVCDRYAKRTIFVNNFSRGPDIHSCGTSETIYPLTDHLPLTTKPSLQNIVLADFVFSALPKDAIRESPLSWISFIIDSRNCNETLSLVGSAIGYGWTGHIEAQPDRVIQSRQFYTQAIARLRKDLAKKLMPYSGVTLATVCALILYELIEYGTYDAQGWLAHTSGIETMISKASAHTFVAGFNHEVFLFCRVVMILRSLLNRRATFLSQDQWCHIPWTLHPKNQLHQLLDLATEVAALLEVHDGYTGRWEAETSSHREMRNLLIKTAILVSRLRCWHAKLSLRLSESPLRPMEPANDTIVPATPMRRSANCHWYPARQYPTTRFPFELIQEARLMLFYWTIMLILQSEIFGSFWLRTELHQTHEVSDDADCHQEIERDLRASISTDLATECADNIVEWFEFAAQDVWNSFGPAFGVFSLKTAITWYSIYQELPKGCTSLQADLSVQLERAQNMLLRLVNYGSPPTHRL